MKRKGHNFKLARHLDSREINPELLVHDSSCPECGAEVKYLRVAV